MLPVLPQSGRQTCAGCAGTILALGGRTANGRLCCVCPVCQENRSNPCPVLGARQTQIYESQDMEPGPAAQALDWIGALYRIESQIREQGLAGAAKQKLRQDQAKPIATQFFAWIEKQFDERGFLPSSPFLGALSYIRERRAGVAVYLDDPDVSIDTNHLERALRVIPMGRKNWLFSWTELGAKHIGIVQSLIVTCRLHDINPYDYFVDVLQRVSQHPASKVHELTPRLWKQHFAANPLRSDLHGVT